MINFLSKYLPRKTLIELYKLYVRPHLDYGDVIYHFSLNKCKFSQNTSLDNQMEKLESDQYSAALSVTGVWKGASRENLYGELGWESLYLRDWSRCLVLFYRFANNITSRLHKMPNSAITTSNAIFSQSWYNWTDKGKNYDIQD